MLRDVYYQCEKEQGAERLSDKEIYAKAIMINAAVDGASKIVLSGSKDLDPDYLFKEVLRTVSCII